MTEVDQRERIAIKAACRKILKSVVNEEPFVALAAMTTVMASIIASSNSPHSDEDIFSTANETLRDTVRSMRHAQMRDAVKH